MVARGYEITNIVEALHVGRELAAGDFDDEAWARARAAQIARYWSGEDAPPERRAEARIVWDARGFVVRFDCAQTEPLVVSATPKLDAKTIGLWDRDVCEIFITRDTREIKHYAEFEVAPTGEWLDLTIDVRPHGLDKHWDFRSGMTVASRVRDDSIVLEMRVPWKALKHTPKAEDRWRCNLFRCVGKDPTRGYLAWQPTHTPEPAFHVPEKFGWIVFKG